MKINSGLMGLRRIRLFRVALLVIVSVSMLSPFSGTINTWQELAEGLLFGEFTAPVASTVGNSRISILKIDPARYDFKLLSAKAHGNRPRTLGGWAAEFGLISAINAGMYQKDLLTSVGYLRSFEHVNNGYVNSNNSVFAFAPKDSTLAYARLIDRTCENFDSLRGEYQCMLQSIRMISCDGKNVWTKQPNRWSISVLGIDKSGNILFIFCQSPYTVHDFINYLLKLPISISRAMYLEGGSKAGFYLSHGGKHIEQYGIYENALLGAENMNTAWPLPNVLGLVRRQ